GCGSRRYTAPSRPKAGASARWTDPMPPAPMRFTTRYWPPKISRPMKGSGFFGVVVIFGPVLPNVLRLVARIDSGAKTTQTSLRNAAFPLLSHQHAPLGGWVFPRIFLAKRRRLPGSLLQPEFYNRNR